MPTAIVVLSESWPCPAQVLAYAALLAKTMGVPRLALRFVSMAGTVTAPPPAGCPPPRPAAGARARNVTLNTLAAVLAEQDALLVVMPHSPGLAASLNRPAGTVRTLLQTLRQPLLLVPTNTPCLAPPRQMALVVDGKAFRLVHGRRAMHALLLTLPIHVSVLHAPVPDSSASLADALESVMGCGLAARYFSAAALPTPPSHGLIAGVLEGLKQVQADILVLMVRASGLASSGPGPVAQMALLQQSPVPVLLLLAAEADYVVRSRLPERAAAFSGG